MSESTRQKVIQEEERIRLGGTPNIEFDIATVFDHATSVVAFRKQARRHLDAMNAYFEQVASAGRRDRGEQGYTPADLAHDIMDAFANVRGVSSSNDLSSCVVDARLYIEASVRAQMEAEAMELYAEQFHGGEPDLTDLAMACSVELTTAPSND
ncbi:hypothetical protein Sste5346_005113 [Sporothrix stenoceras]|uniref:Uncharacterized protein n=1 Tax=Sporothrix stenoceras TaxID=5173 RepID=A0ABR3Z4T3_9PEZI